MANVAPSRLFVLGMDTHARTHTYAVIAANGEHLGTETFPNTHAGRARAIAWAARRTSGETRAHFGGRRLAADPSQNRANHPKSPQKVGFDYVHVAVDDHTRLAYAEVLPDEKGPRCAGFLTRAAAAMAAQGAPVRRVTDNAFAYRLARDFQDALTELGAKHILIKPRHPWQNGKEERFNRTLQEGWAYRQPFTSNQTRTDALQPWLNFYNNHRPHGSLGGKTPNSRCNQPAG